MEISAKTGQNVDDTFQVTVTNIHKGLMGGSAPKEPENRQKPAGSVRIDNRSIRAADVKK